jgi:nucleoid-associated protein YgaU
VAPSDDATSPGLGSVGVAAAEDPEAVDAAAAAGTSEANRTSGGGARLHVVRPGESLWTIAEGLLGPDASPMSIAAEVARVWELNRDRIPSGDPDLIAVGERLRLR